ncbi:MAG: 50S ribosomal protein L17 [Candidatus Peribacteraceae bacterium]|nr:50S ribosomal protein L17 [Candidatus Peribacteraceae bacterium]
MRHRLSRLRLRYKPSHSKMLQRNLVTSLLLYESVRTTKKRAEVVRPIVDRIIAVAKTRQPHVAIRYINAVVTHKNACRKTMEVLKDRYQKRPSGFTRIVPLGSRAGDGAKLVTLELIDANMAPAAPASDEKNPKKPKNPRSPKKEKQSSVASASSASSVSSKNA